MIYITFDPFLAFVLFLLGSSVIFAAIIIPILIRNEKYRKFVKTHSYALRHLDEINKRYVFNKIPNFDLVHSYDNENFYNEISPKDYLTYNLVYTQRKVLTAMKDTLDNKELFQSYKEEIREIHRYAFDTLELPRSEKKLHKTEDKLMIAKAKIPVVSFSIAVKLNLTNINGNHRTSKARAFGPKEIKEIIAKLQQKRGEYYTNRDIWDAIVRVERGKVTNKMRFAIYSRDNYRCRICGRKTNDLEIDHIIPIAKGGKTTMDNLQTLCHRCNVKKGSNIV